MRFSGTPAWLAVLVLLGGCGGDGTLVLQVRTDLSPGDELVRVVVEIEPIEGGPLVAQSRDAADGEDWSRGVRVAELDLAPGSYRATVSARGEGDVHIVGRPVRFEISSSEIRVVTVLLTRDCLGVMCPVAGGDPGALACVGGRCAPEGCSEDTPELCASPECMPGDGTCTAAATCARAECTISGTCFASPDHSMCGVNERCDPERGCVPSGGVADVRTCTTVAMCEPGEGCADEFGPGFGRCRAMCTQDTECGPAQECGSFTCIGDACDPLTGAGCPSGYACDFRNSGSDTVVTACRPAGTTPLFFECTVLGCPSASNCIWGLFGQSCLPFCTGSSECGGEECIRVVAFPGLGLCAPPCDVVLGGGCDPGRACRLAQHFRHADEAPIWTGECGEIGSGRPGDACTTSPECEAAAFCDMGVCRQICDLSTRVCTTGMCTELDPPTMISGVRVGLCR